MREERAKIWVGLALPLAPPGWELCPGFRGHSPFLQVERCLQELERHLQELQAAWALRGQRFEQNRGLQQLQQRLELAEAWLASQEGLLLDPSYGVSGGRSCCSLLTGP